MSLALALNSLIFIITASKSIFDLFINPKILKGEYKNIDYAQAASKKRARESLSTTLVFVAISFISAVNLWDISMDTKNNDIEILSERINKIENYLFPPDGGTGAAEALSQAISSIELLEKEMKNVQASKASKKDLEKAYEILALIKPALEAIKSSPNKKTLSAGG